MKEQNSNNTTDINMQNHWMPFSANRDFKQKPRLMTKAKGVYYWNQQGDKILDGSAGLFTTPLGHCRPEIRDAVSEQLATLDYTPHFNTGHPLSFRLAEELSQILPEGMNKLFFANSGSEAVETVIKGVYAYWRARGEGQKTMFVARQRSYHGVNMGGLALTGIVNNRRFFNPISPLTAHMRHTLLEENRFTRGLPEKGAYLAEDLQQHIDTYGAENIAACIVEPVSGGIGCIVPPQGYLKRLREICDKHDILLIFDEVLTGFGRLGNWFGAMEFGVKPDMISMAKAITNGAVPMAAVAFNENIYKTVINATHEKIIDFFHGYTFSAHPVACAASLATLKIMKDEDILSKVQKLAPRLEDLLFQLQDIPVVKDIRNYGMLAGIELEPEEMPSVRGSKVYQNLFWSGLHVKATGDTLIIAPPFVMEESDMQLLYDLLNKELRKY